MMTTRAGVCRVASALLWLGSLALGHEQSVQIDLTSYFNHKAFGTYPNETTFDTTYNRSYPPLNDLAPEGVYTSGLTGIRYSFPSYTGPLKPDNLICEGQTIPIPSSSNGTNTTSTGNPFSLNMLIANDLRDAIVSYNLTYVYSDGTTAVAEMRALSFFNFLTITHGEIISPFTWTPAGKDWNTSQIFEFTGRLDPTKTLTAVQLPVANNATVGRVHVFSMSVWAGETAAAGPSVAVQDVRPTQKWTEAGNQVVEVTLNNVGTECVSGSGVTLSLKGPGVRTEETASLKRLCPGDQKRVQVGVTGSANGTFVNVLLSGQGLNETSAAFTNLDFGFENFTTDLDSLGKHESPQWFDDGKFGIMIHWGAYSVPAYGGIAPNETYAEWFWWYSNNHQFGSDKSDCLEYRLETFGPDWDYDDGFVSFTASAWDPKEWVDLFADAGAKYFVLTTKHHDGLALFDTGSTSNRSSLHYGPGRDIVQELFDASAEYQPSLKRGTYFSLPEWYNPDFGPYGFSQFDTVGSTNWLGILATNPFTNLTEPYTGRLEIGDFIKDLQYPQMETLAYRYGSDIMWCDCGTANKTAEFASSWWNWARSEDRQVVMNSRCGVAQAADFETPEYTTYSSAQRHKWESNQGMDPYSYGFNAQTPAASYMNASTIVYTLVDIVAKNGNFLLDIGPKKDGTVDETEASHLREAGRWIHAHAEAIFNTTYWFVQTQIASPQEVRFTQTEDAFYILFLDEPIISDLDGYVWVNATLPVLEGDVVSMVGANGTDDLAWKTSEEGYLAIEVGAEALASEEYCWVFKIAYSA
ncbi:family 29 glycoside hydrolase [Cryphonectria parasitica EP155]|uniref:alpha-L-fucosidase n=1 Tax=Cryphonectria parasitica (strain ATCC 38755 / EP155) TaxID=660469 RepID=A0A9P5CNM2_CRYP1|nr:family 29 glycoside hydrolase [Cryphonectria parasitica EP155]KAF3765619.1 family 29 glycoside hydrolase [Cryphonectria parasitica EP155]